MVREIYAWNAVFPSGAASLDLLFFFSGTSGDLGGNKTLPSNWIADWRRLYRFSQIGRDDLKPPRGEFNVARRIDTGLVNPLSMLPKGSFGGADDDEFTIRANLAFRNLTRAGMLKLASGQQMAAFLRSKGVAVTTLTKAQIRDGLKRGVPRRADAAAADDVPGGHPAVVLRAARGRAQRRPAHRRRRADRRGDVPPGDGGQHPLDRA